ncbi:MAG: hypothetical protein HFH91_10115 [Lachnospiraceae bacterium]|nr:hypothetical protein [Lachnospiraceae bacterium]
MEDTHSNTITAFDSLFTTNRIQMLKVLFSWLAPEQQGGFAVYIKLLELQYAFTLMRRHSGIWLPGSRKKLSADFFQGDNTDTLELLDELLPFSGQDERSKIEGMKNMLANLKKMQEMMEMVKMMQELFPEGMGGENPMDMFSNMSDAGLSSIFQMFGGDGKE